MAQETPSAEPSRGARLRQLISFVVWGVWGGMLVGALWFVWEFGRNVPFVDDLQLVPALTWQHEITPGWLWSQYNEHRIPLPRLVMLALHKVSARVTGAYDFRAAMYASVLLLGASAFALIRTAGRTRGRLSLADAFFPLVLLNFAHGELFLWSVQVCIALPLTLAYVLLVVVVRSGHGLSWATVWVAAVCLVLLPLNGAIGLPFVPPLALWLVYLGAAQRRSPDRVRRRTGLLLWAAAGLSVVLVGLSFYRLERSLLAHASPEPVEFLENALQFLALNFMSISESFWPLSGCVVGVLVVGGVLCQVAALWNKSALPRARPLGLLMYLGAVGGLALGVAHGRSAMFGGELANADAIKHYISYAAPAACALYFAWLVAWPAWARAAVPAFLCLVALCLLPLQTGDGLEYGRTLSAKTQAFEDDVRAGKPLSVLLARHSKAICDPIIADQADLGKLLLALRASTGGLYAQIQDDPPFATVRLPVRPHRLHRLHWRQQTARGEDGEAFLEFRLAEARYVAAIQVRYSLTNLRPSLLHVGWRGNERTNYPETPQYIRWPVQAGEGTMTVYVADTLKGFRIHPDVNPFEFHVKGITLLVPAE